VRYWFLKNALGSSFHGGKVGGRRTARFDENERPIAMEYLVQYFAAFPTATVQMAANELSEAFNRTVGKKVCSEIIALNIHC
jgi:hypothetical protein